MVVHDFRAIFLSFSSLYPFRSIMIYCDGQQFDVIEAHCAPVLKLLYILRC